MSLEAYINADYAGSPTNRRSTSGYSTFLGENLVWRSKKQNVVARSSVEAEFRAMVSGVYELLRLKIIIGDLRIEKDGSIRLYCDKRSVINIAHNPVQYNRNKHIEVDKHFSFFPLINQRYSLIELKGYKKVRGRLLRKEKRLQIIKERFKRNTRKTKLGSSPTSNKI